MTTALFMLRSIQLGLSLEELSYLSIGMVIDMITESGNDNCEYDTIATQEDINRF